MASGGLPFALPDRFEFDNNVLSGGQGAVYICLDKLLHRRVAIKQLHNIDDKKTLRKEIKARAKIQSKHVAELYDCWYDGDGKPTELVLEYVPGQSLDKAGARPKETRARLLALYQLACALADMHDAGVIHRDIKPMNMKMNANGILKVFDLGLSNLNADSAETLGAAGTIGFRAPELYNTPPLVVTRAVDIYAFGATAWYIFSGGLPAKLVELPPQHSGSVKPFHEKYSYVPAEIGECIDACLSMKPSERPTSDEVLDLFARHLNSGKHRATAVYAGSVHELKNSAKETKISIGTLGSVKIAYDGLYFVVTEVTGAVLLNNAPIEKNQKICDSCVFTFGDVDLGANRSYVPLNISHPELVL